MGVIRAPWRFESKGRRDSQQRPVVLFQRVLSIAGTFFILGQYLTQLWHVKGTISTVFRKNATYSNSKADNGETMKDSDTGLSPACSLDNFLQDDMYFKASAP